MNSQAQLALEQPQYESMFSPFLEIPAMFMEGFVASWNGESSARTLSDKERESHLKDAIRQEMMQEFQFAYEVEKDSPY